MRFQAELNFIILFDMYENLYIIYRTVLKNLTTLSFIEISHTRDYATYADVLWLAYN